MPVKDGGEDGPECSGLSKLYAQSVMWWWILQEKKALFSVLLIYPHGNTKEACACLELEVRREFLVVFLSVVVLDKDMTFLAPWSTYDCLGKVGEGKEKWREKEA